MPRPIDDELHRTDPDLAASVDIAAEQLEQLFAFLEGYNLQPHEHERIANEVLERLNKKDHRLGKAIEDKWDEHPGWGHKPDKPGHGPQL